MSEPKIAENLRSVIEYLVWLLNSARDPIDRARVGIALAHHEIHDKHSYTYPFIDLDVDIAAPKYILLRTPDTDEQQHLTISVMADGVAEAYLYENPTVSDVGDLRTFINRNRRLPLGVANCLLYEDPTIALDNVLLAHIDFGGAGVGQTKITGDASIRDEFVLGGNQDYVIKVVVAADNTHVGIQPDIYEVTPA
jgi:hypothetical protein